jgi:hypothetical protein
VIDVLHGAAIDYSHCCKTFFMPDLKIPEDTVKHRSKEIVSDSVNVLNLLKGKSIQEIQDTFTVSTVIAKYNAKLI